MRMAIEKLTRNGTYRDVSSGLDLIYTGMEIDTEGELQFCFSDSGLMTDFYLPLMVVQIDLVSIYL